MKYDCTTDRRTLIACRARIKETRRAYMMMMKKRWLALPKSERSRFIAEMPERMRSLGMYAKSTYGRDIIRGIIYLWYRSDPDQPDRYRKYEHWTAWQQKHGVSFAEMYRQYGKVRAKLLQEANRI